MAALVGGHPVQRVAVLTGRASQANDLARRLGWPHIDADSTCIGSEVRSDREGKDVRANSHPHVIVSPGGLNRAGPFDVLIRADGGDRDSSSRARPIDGRPRVPRADGRGHRFRRPSRPPLAKAGGPSTGRLRRPRLARRRASGGVHPYAGGPPMSVRIEHKRWSRSRRIRCEDSRFADYRRFKDRSGHAKLKRPNDPSGSTRSSAGTPSFA